MPVTVDQLDVTAQVADKPSTASSSGKTGCGADSSGSAQASTANNQNNNDRYLTEQVERLLLKKQW